MNTLQKRARETKLNLTLEQYIALEQFNGNKLMNKDNKDIKLMDLGLDEVSKVKRDARYIEHLEIELIMKHDSTPYAMHYSTMVDGKDYFEVYQVMVVDGEPVYYILDENHDKIVETPFESMLQVYKGMSEATDNDKAFEDCDYYDDNVVELI